MIHNEPKKVIDWATDFDHGSQEWADDPYTIIEELKNSGCPMAHTERYGGAWLPVTYDLIKEISLDTKNFSSEGTVVRKVKPYEHAVFSTKTPAPVGVMPPISSDPPFHKIARNLLAPLFSFNASELWRDEISSVCNFLVSKIDTTASVDIMEQYAKKIPSAIIQKMLGIPQEDVEKFNDWINFFVHTIDELPSKDRVLTFLKYRKYMTNHINAQINNPKDNIITHLLKCKILGEPLSIEHLIGTISIIIVAGIHTVSSVIGSSLWHLATNPADRRRLVENPDMIPAAIEEFLRAYAPVTMARLVKEDMEFHGVQMKKEDWVLLSFPAANRDDKQFANAHEVVIDREENRHVAFGLGIHHCLGEHLARLEITIAIQFFLQNFKNFSLDEKNDLIWTSGQVRELLKLFVIFED
jgi:cytochrome P450